MSESLKWVLAAMDPEPGQKYFERHMHHVQNSSRKPVEINRELLADGFAVDTAGGNAHSLCIGVKAPGEDIVQVVKSISQSQKSKKEIEESFPTGTGSKSKPCTKLFCTAG